MSRVMLPREVLLSLTRPQAAHPPAGGFGQRACAEAESALDQARLATDVAREVEDCRLTFAEGTHHLETLDRRVGRLHRLETAHRPNQLLELAVVGLDDVVQILDLTVLRVRRTLAFGF